EFIDRVTSLSASLRVGNGIDRDVDTGPLINRRQLERVEAMVADSVARGAEVLTGGSRPADQPQGYFYNPTVVTNLQTDMPLYKDEIFGPVLPVVPFDDVEQALALANDTEYGLAAYVQTNNMNTAIRMYEALEYGMVAVNDWLPSTPE